MLLDWKNVMKGGIIGPTLVYFKHYTFITRDIASVLIYYMRLVQSPKDRHFISQACVFASSNNSTRSSGFETPRDGKYVPGWQWLVQWRWRKHPKVQVAPSRPLSSYCAVRQACYPQNTEQLLECMPIKTLEMLVCYTLTYRNWRRDSKVALRCLSVPLLVWAAAVWHTNKWARARRWELSSGAQQYQQDQLPAMQLLL